MHQITKSVLVFFIILSPIHKNIVDHDIFIVVVNYYQQPINTPAILYIYTYYIIVFLLYCVSAIQIIISYFYNYHHIRHHTEHCHTDCNWHCHSPDHCTGNCHNRGVEIFHLLPKIIFNNVLYYNYYKSSYYNI